MSVELFHRFDGPDDAPVLVLCNSLGTTIDLWDDQLPALAARFRVLRFDLRGHGRSPVPPGPYTIDDLGGDLLALLDRLGLERVSVCGVSIGGMTAMWLASRAPERVDRLALCCTSAYPAPPEPWLERTPPEGYAAGCEALASLDLRDGLAAIRAPTLVIAGSEDPAAPPSHGELIADSVPGARLLIVPASHLANLEQPEVVTDALVEHLTAEVRA